MVSPQGIKDLHRREILWHNLMLVMGIESEQLVVGGKLPGVVMQPGGCQPTLGNLHSLHISLPHQS